MPVNSVLSLSTNDIKAIMPNATTAHILLYQSFLNTFMNQYQINTTTRAAAFLAQISVESQDLTYTTELSSGQQYEFRRDLGNVQIGDGPLFKGRGLMQITGRTVYKAFSHYKYQSDILLDNPYVVASDPSLAVESACWFWSVYKGNVINVAADSGDFNKVTKAVNGGFNGYTQRAAAYDRANTQLNTGINFQPDQSQTTTTASTNTASNPAGAQTDFNFQQIQANIDNADADDVSVSWGSRLTGKEESDFIGLKQFLLYLTTRYYPQTLVPFVELIPVFSVDIPQKYGTTTSDLNSPTVNNILNGGIGNFGVDQKEQKQTTSTDFVDSTTFLDKDRFTRTALKLNDLSAQGGADIFGIDPFLETTDSFNTPNEIGKAIQNKRGFGYKVFGTVTLNPSLQGESLSKAGSVGLKSLEIEAGSQTQNGMTLVTMKFLDVQGNKFLDINSPWSFILNSRAGTMGADFYFRYGWQVRIPNPKIKDDAQSKRFWSHPGWKLFQSIGGADQSGDNAKTVQEYIQGLASHCDWCLTLTQSPTISAMKTPGYKLDQGTGHFILDRRLDYDDYMDLVLINPELNVNPHDGSIEATLLFRSNGAVANCLALLNGLGLPNGGETKNLVTTAKNNITTLTQLMSAFVKDNKHYIQGNSNLKTLGDSSKNSLFDADYDIKSRVTVIGGAGTDSLIDVDPDSVPIKLTNDLLEPIKRSNEKDNRLLISWLRQVLEANNCALLSAGDKQSAVSTSLSTLNGGFVIAYDSENVKELENKITTGKSLAINDASFGNYINYTSADNKSDNFIGKRLLVQDDVMAFRFQGSLVESISVEKLALPTETTIQQQKEYAKTVEPGENSTDVKQGSQDGNGNGAISSPNVTYQNKKNTLNILYSSMLGMKATCIAHPWLKIARPIYVKGMGFWDGKYMITKLKHILAEDNLFKTEINACRVLKANSDDTTASDTKITREQAMNNPTVKKATQVSNSIATQKERTVSFASIPWNADQYLVTNDSNASLKPAENPTTLLRSGLEDFINNLHYTQQQKFRSFFADVEKNTSYNIDITTGYVSWADQADLKLQDPSNNASAGYSLHNYGLAVDLNLVDKVSGVALLLSSSPYADWVASDVPDIAKKYGLTWAGGSFGEFRDFTHFGLDTTFDINSLRALVFKQYGTDFANIIGNKVSLSGSFGGGFF